MKRIFTTLALACLTVLAFAQNNSILRPRIEIAQVEAEVADTFETKLEVFYMDDENPRMYYLSLGNLGIGSDIIQIKFDPFHELFIPLGGTLEEAVEKMEEIKDYYKLPKRSTVEITGCVAVACPDDSRETVTVTRRQMITSKVLEFSLPSSSEGLVHATHISKSDFNGLLTSLKIYRKLHPKEQ